MEKVGKKWEKWAKKWVVFGGGPFAHGTLKWVELRRWGEWLRCCLAFVHARNRLPSAACRVKGKTPFEVLNQVTLTPLELVEHLRTIGCLCYVVKPLTKRAGKQRKTFRAVMLGYAEHAGQKGYVVRRLSDGVVCSAAHNQVHHYEHKLVYSTPPSYDAWLHKQKHNHADKERGSDESDSSFDVSSDDGDGSSDSDDSQNREELAPVLADRENEKNYEIETIEVSSDDDADSDTVVMIVST